MCVCMRAHVCVSSHTPTDRLQLCLCTVPQGIKLVSAGAGDLLGTGTISGPQAHQCGSLLELTHGGTQPLSLHAGPTAGDAQQMGYLRDGDEVVLRGACKKGDLRIGFGECRGKVLPPRP